VEIYHPQVSNPYPNISGEIHQHHEPGPLLYSTATVEESSAGQPESEAIKQMEFIQEESYKWNFYEYVHNEIYMYDESFWSNTLGSWQSAKNN